MLYINGIQCCSSKLQFVLFDDDTNAVYAHKDLKTVKLTVNTDLHNLYNWLTSNKLSLNIQKSNYVIFGPHQKKLNFDPQVNVFDNESNKKVTLERKNFIKYLGLLIDENLSWKTHIHSVANKISKTIGLIARLRHIVPTCTLLNIYQSLITPYLTYGLISWGNACKTFRDQILALQKRALRLIYFAETNNHAIPFFVNTKILPLKSLYYESVCSLIYDVNKNTARIIF